MFDLTNVDFLVKIFAGWFRNLQVRLLLRWYPPFDHIGSTCNSSRLVCTVDSDLYYSCVCGDPEAVFPTCPLYKAEAFLFHSLASITIWLPHFETSSLEADNHSSLAKWARSGNANLFKQRTILSSYRWGYGGANYLDRFLCCSTSLQRFSGTQISRCGSNSIGSTANIREVLRPPPATPSVPPICAIVQCARSKPIVRFHEALGFEQRWL